MKQNSDLRSEFIKNGFVVIKSIYSRQKIMNLRDKMINIANLEKEILTDKDVQDLVLNKTLIAKIKELLNANKLLYYSDSAIVNHQNPFSSKNGFHNDERGEDLSVPYNQEYPILRVGIYFENFKYFSGGLKIKKGSHKHFCFNFRDIKTNLIKLIKIFISKTRYNLNSIRLGKSINLELEEGDIVIWNLRTIHCGVSRRLKIFPKLCLQPHFEKVLPKFLFFPTQYKNNRCSIFCTFAKDDLTNKNIMGYVKKKIQLEKIKEIKSNNLLISSLQDLGLRLPSKDEITF